MRMEMMKMMEMDGGCSWGSQAPGRGGREEEPPPVPPGGLGATSGCLGGGTQPSWGSCAVPVRDPARGGGGRLPNSGRPFLSLSPPGAPPMGMESTGWR